MMKLIFLFYTSLNDGSYTLLLNGICYIYEYGIIIARHCKLRPPGLCPAPSPCMFPSGNIVIPENSPCPYLNTGWAKKPDCFWKFVTPVYVDIE